MGESAVANIHNRTAFKENPSTLIGLEKMNVYYCYRPMNWMKSIDDMFYFSLGAAYTFKYGTFALDYTRNDMGERTAVHFDNSEMGYSVTKVRAYDHTFILSYANKIVNHFSLGINLKLFDQVFDYQNFDSYQYESKYAIVGDMGLLFDWQGFIHQELLKDKIYLGLSIQNIGTKHKVKTDSMNGYDEITIPKYLRIGFCYELLNALSEESTPFKLLLTGEYKNYLNPPQGRESKVDYGGMGFEITFYNLFSLRMGGIYLPSSNIYGDEKRMNIRYGVGLNVPLEKINIHLPVSIVFNYSKIPINGTSYFGNIKENLTTFDIQVEYGI
ncbi:hypothetical protein MUP95_06720 [bacterium]|nr:hypothetical protein [bacterium]